MFKKTKEKEFSYSVEGTVEFTTEMTCALNNAFNNNPEVVEQLEEMIGEDKLKVFRRGIFNGLDPKSRLNQMRFVPTEEMKTIFSQIAKAELKRIELEGSIGKLSCGHSSDFHRKVLSIVVEKVQPTTQ